MMLIITFTFVLPIRIEVLIEKGSCFEWPTSKWRENGQTRFDQLPLESTSGLPATPTTATPTSGQGEQGAARATPLVDGRHHRRAVAVDGRQSQVAQFQFATAAATTTTTSAGYEQQTQQFTPSISSQPEWFPLATGHATTSSARTVATRQAEWRSFCKFAAALVEAWPQATGTAPVERKLEQ